MRARCLSRIVFVCAALAGFTPVGLVSAGQQQDESAASLGYVGPPPPVAPEVVARDAAGRVTIRAVRITEPPVLDGLLDEAVYRSIPSFGDFVQQEPVEGAPATEKTDVWLLFDDRNLYIAARCWDSHPERMVANDMRRDGMNMFNNENFGVTFDTFHDLRNGFQFSTNPVGGLADNYITDERDPNRDWNAVWSTKSRTFDQGWTVEMTIPFKSLRYRSSKTQLWGVNFRRVVRWKNETSYLTHIPASYGMRGFMKLSSAATLVGIQPPPSTLNLELKPYGMSAVTTDRAAEVPTRNDLGGDIGFDVKYGVTRSLTFDFTYNTDFAQIEEDEQQVNLTRFSLLFPEKREFFLEGQGIFAFGGVQGGRGPGGGGGGGFLFGGAQNYAPILFFSRRIGLNKGHEIPIDVGGRLTGKAGKFSLGLLNIQAGDVPSLDVKPTNFTVFRVKRDILRRSNVGVMYTRRASGLTSQGLNQVYGMDASFSFYESVGLSSYYARSETPGLDGRDASYRGRFEYSADRYGLELEHLVVEPNFKPEVGFLRRTDIRRSFAQARFSPRPKSSKLIRKVGFDASLDHVTNTANRLETREAQVQNRVEFQSGDSWSSEYSHVFEYLPEPFAIAEGVTLPAGGYGYQEIRTTYQLGPQRPVTGFLTFGQGGFYDGRRSQVSYRGRVELSPRLSLDPGVSLNRVKLREGTFTTALLSSRLTYTLTPQMFVASLLQYNSSNHAVSVNARFRWEYRPGSDFFVVYNEGRDTLLSGRFPELLNRTFAIKITRLVRF
jgi:hypothetical protein